MQSVSFCIIEKPFTIWSHDLAVENEDFLVSIDANLYYRMAHNIIGGSSDDKHCHDAVLEEEDVQDRKDVSTLSRLLWHHGMETLMMLLGAYIQAPSAVHGYLLKSKNDDAVNIAKLLLSEKVPKYHRLEGGAFSVFNLLSGIHRHAGWQQHEEINDRFSNALRSMLNDYAAEKYRWEYNSIKHGLRASHGYFGLAVGIQEAVGVPAPAEDMEIIGSSQDASHFQVARPLENATRTQSKVNFATERVSVTWSLEKVLMDLQLLSILIHNVASSLRVLGGVSAPKITFNKTANDEEFWDTYFKIRKSPVPTASFSLVIDAHDLALKKEKDVFDSYKRA